MPKIKGWEVGRKAYYTSGSIKEWVYVGKPISYRLDASGLLAIVIRSPSHSDSGFYEVFLLGFPKSHYLARFNTLAKAEKFAVQWMRQHPRG